MEIVLSIVPVDQIPKATSCPIHNLTEVYQTCLKLETLCEKENGIGLSAVQVGIAWNLFVVKFPESNYRYFVNCEYKPISEEKEKSLEGCLSLRNEDGSLRHFEVERYINIRLKGKELVTDPKLDLIDLEINPKDYYRIVYQHEMDHSSGILISDIGQEFFIWE